MLTLRPPRPNELAAVTALCLRSKGHWGYDAAFLAACNDELTLTDADIEGDPVVVAIDARGMAGVAQVSIDGTGCYLEKLFVEPERMGEGIGARLFRWSVETARRLGARELIVEADPDAAAFYRRMGCVDAGKAPSGSIAGRKLPRLTYDLHQRHPDQLTGRP